jgi:hypothetical protein
MLPCYPLATTVKRKKVYLLDLIDAKIEMTMFKLSTLTLHVQRKGTSTQTKNVEFNYFFINSLTAKNDIEGALLGFCF